MTEIFVNAGELQSLATTLGARAQELEARIDGVPQTAAFLANNWEGEAATAALDRIIRDEKQLRQIAERLTAKKGAGIGAGGLQRSGAKGLRVVGKLRWQAESPTVNPTCPTAP